MIVEINPFPLLLNLPQIQKLGSISKFGKFQIGQFDFNRSPLENNLKIKLPFVGFAT